MQGVCGVCDETWESVGYGSDKRIIKNVFVTLHHTIIVYHIVRREEGECEEVQ
jgi:hypothetical protein